ncbi:MAG: hypothetical protein GQ574_22820 [Crocinitomix sp.]|nr:hypothetical protein [Crocinitomix sp.]
MNIIETFITKYNGIYFEEEEKSAHTPNGKITSQAQSGKMRYKGNKIAVSISEVGGADSFSGVFRMQLILEQAFETELLVFPRSYWSRMYRIFVYGKHGSLQETIDQQYKFTGAKELIATLKKNYTFLEHIDSANVCINLSPKKPKRIIITPAHGYLSVENLENLAETLTLVKEVVFDKRDYTYVKQD